MFSLSQKSARQRPVRLGRGLFDGRKSAPLNNPRFSSFIARNNPAPAHTDRHDARLRGRKRLKTLGLFALGSLTAWVVIESAMAFSFF